MLAVPPPVVNLNCSLLQFTTGHNLAPAWPQFCQPNLSHHSMDEYDDNDDGGKLPCVDHGPLNEGAVGKTEVTVVVWDQKETIAVRLLSNQSRCQVRKMNK